MNRRNFLQRSALVAAGGVLTGAFSNELFARPTTAPRFSLDVLTDRPDLALKRIDGVLRSMRSPTKIMFTQQRLAGSFTGDIVFIKNHSLVDFRNEEDRLANRLFDAAKALNLPAPVQNPYLLKFHNHDSNAAPQKISIIRENILVKELDIQAADDEIKIEGLRGHVEMRVQNGGAQIIDATCKHKTCMKIGRISQAGASLVCIPNGLKIAIEGENQNGIDSVAF